MVAISVSWQLAQREWMPTGDLARTWLSVTDIGGPNTPLLGAHSRFENGWFHPGPAHQLYLWLFHVALGGRVQAMLVAPLVAALAVAIALGLWLERLIGFKRASVFVALYGVFCWGLGGRLIDPWNPMMLLCPLVLFVVACWAFSMGSPRAMPALIALGSFVVQCHLGLLPIVLASSVTAACLFVSARRGQPKPEPAEWTGSLATTACVFVLFWELPLWEELTRHPGNMTLIWRYFLGSNAASAATAGWNAGAKMVAAQLLPWGPWLGERDTPWLFIATQVSAAWLALPVAALGHAAVSSRRRRDAPVFRMCVLLAVMLCAAIFTMTEVRGLVFSYLALFARVIVMFLLGVVAINLFDRAGQPRLASDALRGGLLATVCVVVCACAARAPLASDVESRAYLAMSPAIRAALPSGVRVRVRGRGGILGGADADSLAVVVKPTHRVEVVHDADAPSTSRIEAKPTVDLVVASGGEALALQQSRTARLIAELDTRPRAKRAEADASLARLVAQMRAGGQALNFGALENQDRELQAALPRNVSRTLLERYQAIELMPGRMHISVFLIEARP